MKYDRKTDHNMQFKQLNFTFECTSRYSTNLRICDLLSFTKKLTEFLARHGEISLHTNLRLHCFYCQSIP
jgi:hypothetical protein